MKARLAYSDISTALDAVKPAITSNRPFVQLSTSTDGLTVRADDLNVAITAKIPSWHPMDDDVDGAVAVGYRQLREFLAAVGDDIDLATEDEFLLVGHGATRMKLAVADVEFPQRREVADADVAVKLDGEQWAQVRRLVPFASTDSALGARCGINFFPDLAVATDGFVLGLVRADFGFQVAVPAGVVDAVGKNADEVTLAADDRSMQLTADGIEVRTSRIAGDIGDHWRKMMDAKPVATVTVDLDELAAGVAVARIPARVGLGGGKDMILRFGGKGVHLESWPDEKMSTGEVASYPLVAEVEGVEWDAMGIQERWLDAPLKLVGPDADGKVTLKMSGAQTAVTVDNGTAAALLMPLQRPPS